MRPGKWLNRLTMSGLGMCIKIIGGLQRLETQSADISRGLFTAVHDDDDIMLPWRLEVSLSSRGDTVDDFGQGDPRTAPRADLVYRQARSSTCCGRMDELVQRRCPHRSRRSSGPQATDNHSDFSGTPVFLYRSTFLKMRPKAFTAFTHGVEGRSEDDLALYSRGGDGLSNKVTELNIQELVN